MTTEATDIELGNDEFTALKERANLMGLKFHPNISLEKLRNKVQAAIAGDDDEDEEYVKPVAKKVSAEDKRKESQKNSFELVRVRVTCMDQSKSNQNGVIITAGNSATGTVRKYVPFDTEWHIPRIIYNVMKETKQQIFSSRKDSKGNVTTEGKLVNAYSIEVFPQLTEAELKDLAQRQAMAKGTD